MGLAEVMQGFLGGVGQVAQFAAQNAPLGLAVASKNPQAVNNTIQMMEMKRQLVDEQRDKQGLDEFGKFLMANPNATGEEIGAIMQKAGVNPLKGIMLAKTIAEWRKKEQPIPYMDETKMLLDQQNYPSVDFSQRKAAENAKAEKEKYDLEIKKNDVEQLPLANQIKAADLAGKNASTALTQGRVGMLPLERQKTQAEIAKARRVDPFTDKVDLGDKVRLYKPDGSYEELPKAATPNTVIMGDRRSVSDEKNLRKEFQALPEVKTHVEIQAQLQRLEKAMGENAKGGSKVAVDQALITILNKMLDPESVVRESEYARTSQDISLLNKLQGKLGKLSTGGAGLTDEERDAIATMARNFADVSKTMYDEQTGYYSDLATRYGYAPENIIRLGGAKPKKADLSTMSDDDIKSQLGL